MYSSSTLRERLRLAIIFDQDQSSGGGYNYSLNIVHTLINSKAHYFDCDVLVFKASHQSQLLSLGIHSILVNRSFLHILFVRLFLLIKSYPRLIGLCDFLGFCTPLERVLRKLEADVVYFPSPSLYAHQISRYPFIFTIWDLCHRDHPEFPEVGKYSEFHAREHLYKTIGPRASAIITESSLCKRNISLCYGITPDKIHIISSSVGPQLSSLTTQPLRHSEHNSLHSNPYILYPAQLWPHKNHAYILRGLSKLKSSYSIRVDAFFVGSDKGNKHYLEQLAFSLGISDCIHYTGFVSAEELSLLYRGALAMVMPTYFGPTNIPPLEAFHYGVPVLYSDLPGLRDQVGDSALLVDINDPQSMADSLYSLISTPGLREKLVKSGRNALKLSENSETIPLFSKISLDMLNKAIAAGHALYS